MNNKNKSSGNILTVTKCCECGEIFRVPLDPEAVRAFENSTEVQLICYDCVKIGRGSFKSEYH